MTVSKARFTIVDEQFISYYGGNGYLISNGECEIWLWHSKEESQKVCDKLNNILDDNEQLKQKLELYGEIYPTGKWITKLNSEELKKEVEE